MERKDGTSVHNIKKNVREIIAKAACGKGVKEISFVVCFETPRENSPDSILGCAITNVEKPKVIKWRAPEKNWHYVPVQGTFSIHVWYSYGNAQETNVLNQTAKYHDTIPINDISGKPMGPLTAIAKFNKPPKITGTKQEGNRILVQISMSISVQIIGNCKMVVEIVE